MTADVSSTPPEPQRPRMIPPVRPRSYPATIATAVAILIGFGVEIATGAAWNGDRLARLGAVIPTLFQDHQTWRLVSAMFLHGDGTWGGDGLHLAMNLVALLQLGALFETMFGTPRFLVTYFVSGVFASVASAVKMILFHVHGASVGASGAIFGILGAFIFSIRRSPRYRDDRDARFLIPQFVFWILLNVGIGIRVQEIDNAAHLGGLAMGLALGFLPHRVPPPPPSNATLDVTPMTPEA